MNRIIPIIITVVLLIGATGPALSDPGSVVNPPNAAHQATEQPANISDTNETGVAPGARLAGVVGVQAVELDSEIESRRFGLAVANAAQNRSKAAVIANRLSNIQHDLDTLHERRHALIEARNNGSISRDRFHAQMTQLTAETRTLSRHANQTENVTRGLPADILEENGINVQAIHELRQNASNLTGPEVARIARSIAGPRIGNEISRATDKRPDRPVDRRDADRNETGPPVDRPIPPVADNESRPDNPEERTEPTDRENNTERNTDDQPTNDRSSNTGNERAPDNEENENDRARDETDRGESNSNRDTPRTR